MKKMLLILFALPLCVYAQKEVKPSVSKAETALQKGNFDEAKTIIDATVANQEYMVDKKGNPSKNAAKAWYLKGMIYASLDTTKVEKFKSLATDPFTTAKDAFAKSEEIDKGKSKALVNKLILGQPMEMSKDEVGRYYAQAFVTRAIKSYTAKDYKTAFVDMEKVLYFLPNDTSQLMNAGVFFATAANENEKAIRYIKLYFANGGKNNDAYLQLYSIYTKRAEAVRAKYKDKKDAQAAVLQDTAFNNAMNLALKVAQTLTSKSPNNIDYLNYEYNIYTGLNKLPEAKALMEKRAKADPNDRESRYFLSLICNELKDIEGSKFWALEALKVDPDYFEANLLMAKQTFGDAQKLRDQRNAISGSKDADLKKRQDLYKQIPIKLKESLVFWEKCAALNSTDADVLYGLLLAYSDMTLYEEEVYTPKLNDLKKRMKGLGLEVD